MSFMSTIGILLDRPPICLPSSAGTLEGFRAWATSDAVPENARVSFINEGIIIDTSPEELETHNKVKSEISSVISTLNRDLNLGTFYASGTLLSCPIAGLFTEPDALLVTWDSFQAGRVRPVQRKDRPDEHLELEGTPDWVLEVVSRSSVKKDTQLLREAYHAAGIPEYWVINAFGPEIDFQILLRQSGGYVPAPARDGWSRSPLFSRDVCLTRQRGRLGYWQYTLDVRPG